MIKTLYCLDESSSVNDDVLSRNKIGMGYEGVNRLSDVIGNGNFLERSISGKLIYMSRPSFYPACEHDAGSYGMTLTSGARTLARDLVMLISAALLAA